MADSGAQDKTEQPTPKRKEEARKKGQVAKSMEVNTAIILATGSLLLLGYGPFMFRHFAEMGIQIFGNVSTYKITATTLPGLAWHGASSMLLVLAPFWAVIFVAGLAANFGQVGIRISEEVFKPKWNKLNLFNGLKELFTRAPFELGKNVLKMGLVGTVVFFVIKSHIQEFFYLGDLGVPGILNFIGKVGFEIMAKVVMAVVVLAVIDYAYQRYRHIKQLKMSKQEVKEEFKQTEGDPQVKAKVRQLQEEMARSRMMQDVPEADVVITNPTHYAVALKYKPEEMEAPIVLAKGMRKVAQRIKKVAREHDIPVIENPPLARSLYSLVEVGQEIPAKFYRAIAEILAQIFQMKQR